MLKIETSWQTAARGGMGGDELENAPPADRLTSENESPIQMLANRRRISEAGRLANETSVTELTNLKKAPSKSAYSQASWNGVKPSRQVPCSQGIRIRVVSH
jgi:hypothetical protein